MFFDYRLILSMAIKAECKDYIKKYIEREWKSRKIEDVSDNDQNDYTIDKKYCGKCYFTREEMEIKSYWKIPVTPRSPHTPLSPYGRDDYSVDAAAKEYGKQYDYFSDDEPDEPDEPDEHSEYSESEYTKHTVRHIYAQYSFDKIRCICGEIVNVWINVSFTIYTCPHDYIAVEEDKNVYHSQISLGHIKNIYQRGESLFRKISKCMLPGFNDKKSKLFGFAHNILFDKNMLGLIKNFANPQEKPFRKNGKSCLQQEIMEFMESYDDVHDK